MYNLRVGNIQIYTYYSKFLIYFYKIKYNYFGIFQAANASRFWPSGRGIYHNENKTFLVWCNEEDHLRLISMQQGGNLGEVIKNLIKKCINRSIMFKFIYFLQVYKRLVTAVNDVEKMLPFSHHDRLGFLTFCPTNLGTTIRASVHIQLPKLAADKAKLEEVAGKYNLQVIRIFKQILKLILH